MKNDEPISISLSNVEAILINDAALHDDPGFNYWLIWIPVLSVAMIGGLVWGIRRYLRHTRKNLWTNDPAGLFSELCAAHALTRAQRNALLKLAQLRKVGNPCLIIMDAALWPDDNNPLSNRNLTSRLSELRRILFEPVKLHQAPTSAKSSSK